jgi:hypothetical protein
MSQNGQTLGTSPVVDGKGKVSQVPDLNVPVNRIYNFVEANRKAYFEEHSLDWCLDEIISRGIAEITRQVKTAVKARENKAAGSLLKEFNLSPADAKKLLLELAAAKASQAKA